MKVCEHCGAVWDEAHEQGTCGVRGATNRILAGWRPRIPVWDRENPDDLYTPRKSEQS